MKHMLVAVVSLLMAINNVSIVAVAKEIDANLEISHMIDADALNNQQEEASEEQSYTTVVNSENTAADWDLDYDELVEGYIQMVFDHKHANNNKMGGYASKELSEAMEYIYNRVVPVIQDIARGNRVNTTMNVGFYNFETEIIGEGDSLYEAMCNALINRNIDIGYLEAALLYNHPYELYWYNRKMGMESEFLFDTIETSPKTVVKINSINLKFPVINAYAKDIYEIDPTTGTVVQAAAEKARAIVEENKAKSKLEILNAYKDAVCDLATFNSDAASYSFQTQYGNPWQLVWVFDGDDSTEVVSEGYAKAFAYLCDLTEFTNISTKIVSGRIDYGKGGIGHVWNVIAMGDGRNYLADIANCDQGRIGADDKLFLKGYSSYSPLISSYGFQIDDNYVTYMYDYDTLGFYDSDELLLSSLDFEDIIEPISLSFSETEIGLKSGDSISLSAKILPIDAFDKSLKWTSDNREIAKVDNGTVTAYKAGTTTIRATTSNGLTASCLVTVDGTIIETDGIVLSNTSLSLAKGEITKLTETILPENATDREVTWKSSDVVIVSVDSNGTLTAHKAGIADITVTTSNRKSAKCTVTVVDNGEPLPRVTVKGVMNYDYANQTVDLINQYLSDHSQKVKTLDSKLLDFAMNRAYQLAIFYDHSDAKGISWDDSNLGDGAIATDIAIGFESPQSVVDFWIASGDFNTVNTYDEIQYIGVGCVEVDNTYLWFHVSSDKFTAASTQSGQKTEEKSFDVMPEIAPLILLPNRTTIHPGESIELNVKVFNGISDFTVSCDDFLFFVDNDAVTVDENGIVTGVKKGVATITAVNKYDDSYLATATVEVAEKEVEATSVILDKTSLSMTKGESQALIATVFPFDATNRAVLWTSSNPSVATVDETGYVSAVNEGIATITASTSNDKIATCIVTVEARRPIKILQQPQNLIGKLNSVLDMTVIAEGVGLTYQWWTRSNGSNVWNRSGLAGYKTPTLSILLNQTNAGRTYKCVITDANGFTEETDEVSVTIATLSITSEPADISGISGISKTLSTYAGSSVNASLLYQWQFRTKGTEAWKNSGFSGNNSPAMQIQINATNAGREFRCKVSDEYGNVIYTRTVIVTMVNPVKITMQPIDLVGKRGQTVFATVAASGEGLTYQWYFQTIGANTWIKSGFAGNNSSCLEILVNTTNTARRFKCIVTDKNGEKAETNAIVVKAAEITIVRQPVNVGGRLNEIAKASVEASGDGLRYQWYFRTKGTTSWKKSGFIGFDTDTLSISINSNNVNREYYCNISDAYGNTAKTNVITAVVSNLRITKQPVSLFGLAGETVTTIMTASGEELRYQWYFKSDGTTAWRKSGFAGNTTPCMAIPVNATSVARSYKCIVTDRYGVTAESDLIRVEISSLKILAEPEDIVTEIGFLGMATVTARGEGLKYQWYFKTKGTNDWKRSGYDGSTTSSLDIPVNNTSLNRTFKCVITDQVGNRVETREVSVKLATGFNWLEFLSLGMKR